MSRLLGSKRTPAALGLKGCPVASIHSIAEKRNSRKLGFRRTEFSETQPVPLLILGNPIYRGASIHSGLGLYANAPTTFRSTEFSETRMQPVLPHNYRTGAWRVCPASCR